MDVSCASLSSFAGIVIPWVKEIRYLGVYISQSRTFYRAMHFSAKRGIAIACRLSVRPSVCDVGEL